MNKPRWTNLVNLSGIYSKKPVECKWKEKYAGFWDKTGNLDANEVGLVVKSDIIQFTSEDRETVEAWTLGARSVMSLLKRWAHE